MPRDLTELQAQLMFIINICKQRTASGFDSHTSYFDYNYELGERIKTNTISCPVCVAFDAIGSFTGDQLDANFPDAKKLGDTTVYPDVHTTYPEMEKQCGCELELTDLSSACAEALADEIRMSVI